jgi:hypothetical protein
MCATAAGRFCPWCAVVPGCDRPAGQQTRRPSKIAHDCDKLIAIEHEPNVVCLFGSIPELRLPFYLLIHRDMQRISLPVKSRAFANCSSAGLIEQRSFLPRELLLWVKSVGISWLPWLKSEITNLADKSAALIWSSINRRLAGR